MMEKKLSLQSKYQVLVVDVILIWQSFPGVWLPEIFHTYEPSLAVELAMVLFKTPPSYSSILTFAPG